MRWAAGSWSGDGPDCLHLSASAMLHSDTSRLNKCIYPRNGHSPTEALPCPATSLSAQKGYPHWPFKPRSEPTSVAGTPPSTMYNTV